MWTVRLECSTAARPFICRFDVRATTRSGACIQAIREANALAWQCHGIVSVERKIRSAA